MDVFQFGSGLTAPRAAALFHTELCFPLLFSLSYLVLPTWGRNGFDGDKEALAAYRAPIDSLNRWEINIIADDYELALAA